MTAEVKTTVKSAAKTAGKAVEKAAGKIAEKTKAPAKKPVAPKKAVVGGGTYLQIGDGELDCAALRAKALQDAESRLATGTKLTGLDVYIKPEDGKAYYVAKSKDGEAEGSVDL